MQGKILSPQLISGDDGKRYEYDKNDVVNLGNRDLALLTGSQVEFLSFDKRVAKSIYIILSADRISPARTMALWGIGLIFFIFIPYIGLIIAIASFVLYSMAIYSVSKAVASKSLFKNYIGAVIIGFFGFIVFSMPVIIISLASGWRVSIDGTVLFAAMFPLLIALIYVYRIHTELARLSGSSLFLWAFWIYAVNVLLCFAYFIFVVFASIFIFLGYAGFIVALVLLFIAWWRFGKVEKR
ncbi:hypothetical protein [Campylobacter sp.]|uniref:hypothetical protein n=1 Tax=Campylobacter sp. TaxID=205 RepID=UPI002A52CD2F|nr:hypothetical protein [Campylobacter sp.]MDD7090654.1 hypothetical protein [Campylobacteraceae bacterium]MDY5285651.1 hypothetical protein [Campylobacter sp.]